MLRIFATVCCVLLLAACALGPPPAPAEVQRGAECLRDVLLATGKVTQAGFETKARELDIVFRYWTAEDHYEDSSIRVLYRDPSQPAPGPIFYIASDGNYLFWHANALFAGKCPGLERGSLVSQVRPQRENNPISIGRA